MFSKKHHERTDGSDISRQLHVRTNSRKRRKGGVKKNNTWGGFNNIFEAITDPIMVFDTEFKLIKVNKAAKYFFSGYPVGKKCFLMKHKFALACKNCPTWLTIKTGVTTTSEILKPQTSIPILLKTYPIFNRLKKIKGVVLVGRESNDVPIKLKR